MKHLFISYLKNELFSRDIIIYALSCRTSGLDRVVELLSETIFRPKFLPEEVIHDLFCS
jgi:predicted Zn-dependent peptidase